MIDSIASAYTTMSQSQLRQQASTAVLKQAMDVQKSQGAAMAKLLSSASSVTQGQPFQDPMVGRQVDMLV